jgi:hypothetical protein
MLISEQGWGSTNWNAIRQHVEGQNVLGELLGVRWDGVLTSI